MVSELISVIVPVYNVVEWLPRCLDSIAAQTYSNIEVILVDDGSTDGSGELCDEWCGKDPRFRVIHQDNKWLAEARNAGLDASRGDFVYFIDSDDYIRADALAKLRQALLEHPDCDVAVGNYMEEGTDFCNVGLQTSCTEVWPTEKVLCSMASFDELHMVLGTAWNILIPKRLAAGNRFPSYWGNEDFPFNLRVYLKMRAAAFVGEPLYFYTVNRTGSIMDNVNMKGERFSYMRLLAFWSSWPDLHDIQPKIREIYLQRLYKFLVLAEYNITEPSLKVSLKEKKKEILGETSGEFIRRGSLPFRKKALLLLSLRCPAVSSALLRALGN